MNREKKIFFIVLSIILFSSGFFISQSESYADSNRLPMTLDWKLKNAPDGTYWLPQDGDRILVYGTINAGYESTFEIGEIQTDVSLVLSDPIRERISIEQAEPTCAYDQCYFEWTIVVGSLWKYTGQYEIQACYLGHNNPYAYCASTEIPYVKRSDNGNADELMITITDSVVMDRTQIDLEFNTPHVNYEITATQNSKTILQETAHAMEMTASHMIDAVGSDDSPVVIKIVSLGVGFPGDNQNWSGPVGIVATMQVDDIKEELSSTTGTFVLEEIEVLYKIRGGTVENTILNTENNSIIIEVKGFDNPETVEGYAVYYFELWLPHSLIDTKSDGFFTVLINDQTLTGGQSFQYEDPRWIGISYEKGHQRIEIIGDYLLSQTQSPSTITVSTDKSSYTEGDIIKISGKVTNPNSVSKVSIVLKAPNGNLVSVSQHSLSYDNTFSTTLTAGGALMNVSGTYRFVVQYGSENISDNGSFYYSAPVVKPTPTQTTIISVEVSGLSHYVEYRISGGKLLSIIPDMGANSLILSIDSSSDGSISVELPRKLIDAKMRNGDDDQFFVLVDGNEAAFDEKSTSSTRIITIEFPAGAEELEIIGTIVGSEQPTYTPPTTTSGTISVSTDDFQYSPSDLVTVTVSTSKSANVAISVIGPGGDNIVSRSVTTDSRGSGSLQFKLPESSQNGSYRIDSTATISGSKVSDSTTFTVQSTSSRVSIISLQPTDQQGNTVSTFTKGTLGFVKVVLSSDASVNSLVTINLFDSDLTSLGIGSFKTTLGSGQSEMTLSFFIPNYADLGNGDIYANIFSDWPSQGGVPLTGESSTQVRIQ